MSSPSSPAGSQGQQYPEDSSSEFNAHAALVRSMLSKIATSTVVEVVGVTNAGGVSPTGYVDVQPLVNQVDGAGNAIPHAVVFGAPYGRLMGGTNAVILDPEVGDLGIVNFASRDISSVLANQAQANPGSWRRFDWADAMYVGVGLLGAVPGQYVQFSAAGITIHSPTLVKLEAPDVQISCETLEIAATTSASVTTPMWTVNGNQVNNGDVNVSGTVQAPTVDVTTELLVLGKDLGPNHEHTGGTLTGGHTGMVI